MPCVTLVCLYRRTQTFTCIYLLIFCHYTLQQLLLWLFSFHRLYPLNFLSSYLCPSPEMGAKESRREESRQQMFNKMSCPCLGAVILKQCQLNMTYCTAASSVLCVVKTCRYDLSQMNKPLVVPIHKGYR